MIEQHARDWFSKVLVHTLSMMDRDDIQIIEPSSSVSQNRKDGELPHGPKEWINLKL